LSQQPSSKQSLKQPSKKKVHRKLIGPVRALRDGYGFVQLEDHENVSLGKQDMRRVFPGDVVEVSVGKEDRGGRIQGKILEVLERNTHELVGTFNLEQGLRFVEPSNSRIAHDIHIPKEAVSGAEHGQVVVVEITEQPGEFAPAYGQVKEVLGDELSAGMEIQVALRTFDIPHEWPEEVEDEADKLGSSVKTTHKKHRRDLRNNRYDRW